jgi:predicted MFS family arabinose efflux permease
MRLIRLDFETPLHRDSFRARGYALAPERLRPKTSPIHQPSTQPRNDTRGAPAGGQNSRPHGVGFWVVAGSFLMSMAFSAAPAPLYPLYERRDGFSSFTVTIVFAVYAVGVIAGLLLAGHISDWLGRKRVLIPALGAQAIAAGVFLAWPALPGLLTARLLTGAGVGIISATATAYLLELHAAHRPHAGHTRFEIVSSVANVGGLGVGPLITGLLAQFAPAPLRIPYIAFAAILVLCMLGVSRSPETVAIPSQRPGYRPQRPSLGVGDVATYITAAGGAITATAIFALFISLAPGFIAGTLHHPSRALAGVILFVVFAAATVTQTASARLAPRRRQYLGAGIEAAGLIILAIAMRYPDLGTFLVGGILAVGGAGILFKSALSTVSALATSGSRGGTLAAFYFIAYLGLTVPTLGLGIATQYFSAATCVLWFAAILLSVLILITLLNRVATTEPPDRTHVNREPLDN